MVKDNSSLNDEKPLIRSPLNDEKPLIKRGRVDSVNLYEVKENELELLEKGSPANLQLNFAIFLFSIALTCIVALATSNFKWEVVKLIFIVISVVGVLGSAFLIMSWWRARTPIAEIVSTIRNRINQDPIQTPERPEDRPKKPENDNTPYG